MPSLPGRSAIVAGLAALAFTQPLLDLMGRNPEFFVAGRYTASQIVIFGAIVAFVPAILAAIATVVPALAHRRLGVVAFVAVVAGLGAVFGNVVLRGAGVDRGWAALATGVAGAALAVFLVRTVAGALLLKYLGAAPVLFLAAFLLLSPTSRLLSEGVGPEALGDVSVPTPPGPVVMIVFDEFPVSSLMLPDGSINEDRYPNFARLASRTTWYRNASSIADRTHRAVPAILTGTDVGPGKIPTFDELPRNVISLLSRAVPVERYEAITDVCPPDACEQRPGQSVRNALRDASIVYGHRVLPARFRGSLPGIDDAWGDFGDGVDADVADVPDEFEDGNPLARFHNADASERDAFTQNRRLVEIGLGIDGTPKLHFAHVMTPHAPWSTTPWGHRVMPPWPGVVEDPDANGYEWSQISRYQRHSLQVGALDVALGEVLDRIDRAGAWDDATIVMTADHGISMLGPDLGRTGTINNRDEVYRVPLFLKLPGERGGVVIDEPAQTIDIVPTLVDALGIETSWEFDGHSLIDGSERTFDLQVEPGLEPLLALVRRHDAQFPAGHDWDGLFAVGEHGSLVGRPVSELTIGAPSEIEWDLENEDRYGALPTGSLEVPQVARGRIRPPGDEPPPPLVIALNGVIAGVTGSYGNLPDGWSFSSTLGPYFVDGENTAVAYEVTEEDGEPVLHRVR